MSTIQLEGRALAQRFLDDINSMIQGYTRQGKRAPGLAVILIGDHLASSLYVRNKQKACAAVGIYSQLIQKSDEISETELLTLIHNLNLNDHLDGILVQL